VVELDWFVQCQLKVTGWGIMLICGMVLQYDGTLKPSLSLDQLQQIGQTDCHT